MIVMCLYQATEIVRHGVNDQGQVFVGNIYTVLEVREYNGEDYYSLEEIKGILFFSEMFAVLPDATSDEMSEAEKEGIANLETVMV